MPIRCVTSPIRSLWLGLALALGLAPSAGAQTAAPSVSLSLPQARAVAGEALRAGDPALALKLAAGLLRVNPSDPYAHYVIANAYAGLDRPTEGRRAAARAYRLAQTGPDRFRAAELAARLAYREARPTLAQIWLRRTAIHAPSERDKEAIARDYRTLRRQNPWSFSLRGGLRPSNNVNGGSDYALNMVDGTPIGGFIPVRAQALSGLVGVLDMGLGYRLAGDADSLTTLSGRLYLQRVRLSASSRARAPGVSGAAFGSDYAAMSLRHAFAAGPQTAGGTAAVELTAGLSRYGGARNFRFARIEAERAWRLSEATMLRLGALAERRFDARSPANDARIFGLSADLGHVLPDGDRVALSLALRDSEAAYINGTYRSASLRSTYTPARRMGPARVTFGLTLGTADYPSIVVACLDLPFCTLPVTAPRHDRSAYADVSFFFEEYDYAGFAPTLRLRAGRNRSNVASYDSREFSISLGIASKF